MGDDALEYVGMKEVLLLIGKMICLQSSSYREFLTEKKAPIYSRMIVIMAGVIYGIMGIYANAGFIASFESELLRNVAVPFIFILFGLFSVWLTRLGLAVLLWAGARGFGGPGNIGDLNRGAAVALIPGLLAIPGLTGAGGGLLTWAGVIVALIWMYFICVKIHETTQGFQGWKAYTSVFAVFVFFASIYYILVPPGL